MQSISRKKKSSEVQFKCLSLKNLSQSMGLLRIFKCNVKTARDNLKMNWPLIFTLFNIQRPYLRSHCELYNVIKKAGRASKQMDMKQTLDNNIFIEAKMEAHKINDYICKTGLTAIFWRWRTVRSRGFQGDRNSHKEFQAKNQKETILMMF